MLNNTINPVHNSARLMVPSTDASTSSLVPDGGILNLRDASSEIPHDQLRMIENINSLISEVVIVMFSYYHYPNLDICHAFHYTFRFPVIL